MNNIKFIPEVHPSFKQQFDKITTAYIKGEVDPYRKCACFIGNLLNRNGDWIKGRNLKFELDVNPNAIKIALSAIIIESCGLYSLEEIYGMERLFLNIYQAKDNGFKDWQSESSLFRAMSITLEKLKELHMSKGEIIDEEPILKKRELAII